MKTVDTPAEIYHVSELNHVIRELLEGQFDVLWLRGEISNFKAHPSGHFYFSLKDAHAQISAVMFRGFNRHLRFTPQEGQEVLVRGKVTVYEPRGQYQIFCEVMEPIGVGSLQLAFMQLKNKLQKEGLFDSTRKRLLPRYPAHVALVTALKGAAIRDMLQILKRRNSSIRITIVPVIVQGQQAPLSIVKGLELAQKVKDVEVIIVGRGGGSIEDLWGFNDENVVRAIVASKVPVISAVGHEIDFTLADFAADLRAPTPSAAAEMVVRESADMKNQLKLLEKRLLFAQERKLQNVRQGLDILLGKLKDPRQLLRDFSLRQQILWERLLFLQKRKIETLVNQWKNASSLLHSLSPFQVIKRGYALVWDEKRKLVKEVKKIVLGKSIYIQLTDGLVAAKVSEINLQPLSEEMEKNEFNIKT